MPATGYAESQKRRGGTGGARNLLFFCCSVREVKKKNREEGEISLWQGALHSARAEECTYL